MPSPSSSSVTLIPYSSGAHLSPDFAQLLIAATQGGHAAQDYLAAFMSDQSDLHGLVQLLQLENPPWINGTLADGTPAVMMRSGNAFVAIASSTIAPADLDKLNLNDANYTTMLDVTFGTFNVSTVNKIAAAVFDSTVGDLIREASAEFVKALLGRLTAAIGRCFSGAAGEAQLINGQGQAAPEVQIEMQELLEREIPFNQIQITVEFDFRWMDALESAGRGFVTLIGWAASFAIAFFAIEFLLDTIFKTFNVVVNVVNITDQTLQTTLQYAYNIQDPTLGASNANLLLPVFPAGSTPFNNLPTDAPLVHYGTFVLQNDSELKGLGLLMAIANVTPQTASPLQNAILTVDVPYVSDNSMSVWFNETSSDWSSLYEAQEGVNRVLASSVKLGNTHTAYLSTNALQGAAQEQYIVNLVIADDALYAQYQAYAAQTATAGAATTTRPAIFRDGAGSAAAAGYPLASFLAA
jgi:hypothetical protein